MPLPPQNPEVPGASYSPLSRMRPTRTGAHLVTEAELWATLTDYRQRTAKLISDDQLAKARSAIRQARTDWAAASARFIGDADRWDAERRRRRESLQKQLHGIVPEFGQLRELQAAGTRAVAERAHLAHPVFEPVIMPADPEPTVHRPPFAQDRLGPLDEWAHNMAVADRSFVRREIGHLIVDADLTADPGGVFGFAEWFGIIPPDHGCVSAACGTAFTMPEAGRLQVTATLRNLYNRTTLSITDEWGSSWGSLWVDATIFVAVLRPDGGEVLHSLLADRKLESDGDDKTALLPAIDQQVFRLLGNTEGRFGAGESVFVLAGVFLDASSALNDMEAHVRTLMWWVLEELGIAVVQ